MKYQGYTSWSAWNVAVWFSNDYDLYTTVVEHIKKHGHQKAARVLHSILHGQRTPDGARYSLRSIKEAINTNFDGNQ